MTDKEILARYEANKIRIRQSTPVPRNETDVAKQKRILGLMDNFEKFCEYYFPQYFDSENQGAPFGWFHKKAAKVVSEEPRINLVLEWPREHAKSMFATIMLPIYLLAQGKLSGMILASASNEKAKGLLADLQNQLENNLRFINDYGVQFNFGSWAEQHFTTRGGIGFWAYGKGQNPRGTKEDFRRPNLLVMDDIDDDKECENPKLIRKSVRWIKSALIGTISIKGDRRIIMVGNRIHKESILAHYVGDVHEGDPVRPGINQIKVFALENPRTHKEDQSENGKPAWKERYSRRDLETVFEDMGYAMAQREFFHRLIEEGTKFKSEWLVYDKIPALKAFQSIVTYCDPSFKEAVTNDFKAIVCIGYLQPKWYIIDCWVRQASRSAMVSAHYDMAERLEGKAKIVSHHIEANFTQDMMIQDYVLESAERRYMLPINEDLRAKPKKEGRIESLTVYFEKGLIIINDELIHDKTKFQDWQAFKDQLIGFPDAPHDDAPDAFEGAMFKIREAHLRDTNPIGLGGKRRDTHF